jgi:hypothetical protein
MASAGEVWRRPVGRRLPVSRGVGLWFMASAGGAGRWPVGRRLPVSRGVPPWGVAPGEVSAGVRGVSS